MPFMTIDATPVKVRTSTLKADRIQFLETARSFSGALRVQKLANDKRIWRGETPLLSYSEAQAVISLINGKQVTLSGDVVGGSSVTCWGTAVERQYTPYGSNGWKTNGVIVEFSLEEV